MPAPRLYVNSQNCYLHSGGQVVTIPSVLFVENFGDAFPTLLTCRFQEWQRGRAGGFCAHTSIFRPNFPSYACFSDFMGIFLGAEIARFSSVSLLSSLADEAQGEICDISVLLAAFFSQIRHAFRLGEMEVVVPRTHGNNAALLQRLTGCTVAFYPQKATFVDFDVAIANGKIETSPFNEIKKQCARCEEFMKLAGTSNRPINCYFNSYFHEIMRNQISHLALSVAFGCKKEFITYMFGGHNFYAFKELAGI